MEQLEFKLEVFEGPLDLLLHLIAKHKLNIYDIPITALLEQYLNYIEQMKMADLEVTSDFLAMAAHLVYIKTVSLLPKHEEAETLKQELQGQLLEYQLCKEVAARLKERFEGHNIFVREPQKIALDKTYRQTHDVSVLLKAYQEAAGKAKRNLPPPRTAFSGIVSRRMVSVTSRIVFVLNRLYSEGKARYQDFFSQSGDRSEMVATFLAILELMKSKRITVDEENTYVYFNREAAGSDEEFDEAEYQ
ncbi:segregation and condensation protein A [Massiliimalia timonensis]|uniref:segregation and condensation protein A n=1 Tax=Massiliimalia timonensis TaxID=1987501 RepID=UPI00189D4A01|nr:segregation/condensation protein A [Massiliimalia timonensis]